MASFVPGAAARTLVASDWHLGARSPAAHARLAHAFLERARVAEDQVVLNGDVFEGLFESPTRAEAAHAELARLMRDLAREGWLLRLEGNHDPGAGPGRTRLDLAGIGAVLVEHGHAADPLHGSRLGRLGDRVSRRFGDLGLVRGAAALAQMASRAVAGEATHRLFRERCLARVADGGFALGIFGHVHRQHLEPGDRYANSGWLHDDRLEYLVLDATGIRRAQLTLAEAQR